MSMTSRKNLSVKGLQSMMAREKKYSDVVRYEWEMACNTSPQRGNVYSQEYINSRYSRNSNYDRKNGASKVCHLTNEYGQDFKYIVIKRHLVDGYMPNPNFERNEYVTGNQLVDEINCWQRYAETEDADFLCPILKYFTSKSDKVTATSEKMQSNVVIISQKAVFVGDADDACYKAEQLNRENGLDGESRCDRYRKLQNMSQKNNWRDAMFNSGNSGVIFDYNKNCYKAVFIDYAL